MIALGSTVRCKLTGFKGIAVARADFLYGCTRYDVQPKAQKDGSLPDSRSFDEEQLEVVTTTRKRKKPTTGGERSFVSRASFPKR